MAGATAALPLAPSTTAGSSANLYEALRVGRAATRVEIRAAYRAMAKRLHPDVVAVSCSSSSSSRVGGGPAEAFLEIRRAYETLSDADARARYDRSLAAVFRAGAVAGSAGGGAMRVRRWETDQCW